jgi:hypothetical protein
MKKSLSLALLLALMGTCAAQEAGSNPARASDPFTFDFDLNGDGMINLENGAGFQPLDGSLMPDPTQAGGPMVLTYLLPGPLEDGDIRIWGNANDTDLLGVLRFTDANGDLTGQTATRMIFYSATTGGPDLGDTGLPATLYPEDGGFGPVADASGDFTWAPGGPAGNIYNGVFGPATVPEPATWALLLAGAGALFCAGRKRVLERKET